METTLIQDCAELKALGQKMERDVAYDKRQWDTRFAGSLLCDRGNTPYCWPVYVDFCKGRNIDPALEDSTHEFFCEFEMRQDGICELCGYEADALWESERDPYGTGDSPTRYHVKGSLCCEAELVDVQGEIIDDLEYTE